MTAETGTSVVSGRTGNGRPVPDEAAEGRGLEFGSEPLFYFS